jgi:hypothetical protein
VVAGADRDDRAGHDTALMFRPVAQARGQQ